MISTEALAHSLIQRLLLIAEAEPTENYEWELATALATHIADYFEIDI